MKPDTKNLIIAIAVIAALVVAYKLYQQYEGFGEYDYTYKNWLASFPTAQDPRRVQYPAQYSPTKVDYVMLENAARQPLAPVGQMTGPLQYEVNALYQ